MIKISTSKGNQGFKTKKISSWSALSEIMKTENYSFSEFKNNDRKSINFIGADAIGLDFDEGLTIIEAEKRFKEYKHIIVPTKSHKKKKNGKYSDRFRVVLFLKERITSNSVYKNTIQDLLKTNPEADKACSDSSRFFYPSQHDIFSSTKEGILIKPIIKKIKLIQQSDDTINFKNKPEGFTNCKFAISQGLFEGGERNSAMMSLVTQLKGLDYTKEMAYHLAKNSLQLREQRTGESFDSDDLWNTIIGQVYNKQWRGAAYTCKQEGTWLSNYCDKLGDNACSHEESTFDIQPIGDFFKQKHTISWFVTNLLSEGSCSIIAGPPKSGKSTLIRQLIKSCLAGGTFLGRTVKTGSVLYLALEEHKGMLTKQLSTLKIKKDDKLYIHVGAVNIQHAVRDLEQEILKLQPSLVIIDTLGHVFNVNNLNDYGEVNSAFTKYRELARKTNTHIMFVHHSTKGDDRGQSGILGSVAISGATDCNLVFYNNNNVRFLSTTQRGGIPFRYQKLKYNAETEVYSVDSPNISDNNGEF